MAAREVLKIAVPAPNIQTINVKIKGLSPLIFHRWSEKAKKMILDKQQKKAQKGREVRNPEEEYEASFYYNSDGKVAFPALAIKQCLIGSARSIEGLHMTIIRAAIFIVGDKDGLIEVKHKKKEMREDMVRIGLGTADLRFRGQVTDWSMEFLVKFNADLFSPEQIMNLIQIAGFSSGLGEWRTERGGDFGSFEIESEK